MTFESEVQDIDEVTKRLKISIPADVVEREFESAIKGLLTSAKVKGFRQGKAPRQMVEQLHGSRVRMEVANRLISSSLQDAIGKLKIDMVGMPEIDVSSFEPGQQIKYTAEISIFPAPKISAYDSFEVEVPKREVGDTDIDAFVENVRERSATLRKLEFRNTAQLGDVIDASAVIYVQGEEPSPAEPLVVRLGDGLLPEDVEKGLVGLEIGETRELSSRIPDNHAEEKLRGQQAQYRISLNALSERVLPEVNDEWAKNLKAGAETLLELRIKFREMLEEEANREADSAVREAILKQLLTRNPFKVPQVIIDDQIRHMLVRSGLVDTNKIDPSKISMEPFREKLGAGASERACTTIIIDNIAAAEGLKASKEELEKALADMAQNANAPLDEVKKYFADSNRMVGLALEVSRNKVMDLLVSRAKVKYSKALPQVAKVENA